MKLLLTSAGIKNHSIEEALVQLLGKPISESNALSIPTAMYGMPGGILRAWNFFSGEGETPMCELGWKSMGVLELAALPSIDPSYWVPLLEKTDALLVSGGDPLYLYYWMKESGLSELLPKMNLVYVGLSAGSMVMAPRIGQEFVGWIPPWKNDYTLGIVDFAIFPHLDHVLLPENTMKDAADWANNMQIPCYAIDDQTAIWVVDKEIQVISEGHWKRFLP